MEVNIEQIDQTYNEQALSAELGETIGVTFMAQGQSDLSIQVETGETGALVNLNQRYRTEDEETGVVFYFYEFNVADDADVSEAEITFSCEQFNADWKV